MKKPTTAPETTTVAAEKPAPAKATKKTPAKAPAVKTVTSKPEAAVTGEASKAKPKAPAAAKTTKTTKTQTETPASSNVAETAQALSAVVEKKPKVTPKKASPAPKAAETAVVVEAEKSPEAPELTMHERVGLTAGDIWQYLAEHGATPVAKLVYLLPEKEIIIQRSIGWLAQEGKITLSKGNQVETIALK